jgi:hypothetical protein
MTAFSPSNRQDLTDRVTDSSYHNDRPLRLFCVYVVFCICGSEGRLSTHNDGQGKIQAPQGLPPVGVLSHPISVENSQGPIVMMWAVNQSKGIFLSGLNRST